MDYESFRGAFEPENLSGFFEDSEQNFFGTFGQNTILVTDTYEITLTYIDPNRTLLSIYNIKTSETQEAYLTSGKTMNSLSQQFYLSTSATSLIGGEWANEKPTIPQYKYLWTRFHIIFNDDTTYDTVASYDTASNEEVVRERNEADRVTAEYARRDAESRRVAAEGTRYEAERMRVHDENDRIRAENTRQTNETIREQSYATAQELAQSVRDDADAGLFDGFTPSAEVTKSDGIATITITDKEGTTTTTIKDGMSPIATVIKTGNTATITITDKDGTTTAEVYDGPQGPQGPAGEDAPQIDDDHALSTNPWSGAKVNDELTQIKSTLSEKQDAPTTPGTAGQILALDTSLNPIWADGGSGGSTDHRLLTHRDDAGAHPISAITGLQSALDGCVAKQQGVENIGKIMKVDANGELNLANFYTVVANDQGGNTLTI